MAERRLGTLRHIVFILKTCMLNVANWFVSCSGIFAARTPARRALRLRECYGLPTVNRYHGTLTPPRIAPSRPFKEETEVSLYPTSPSSQAAAPHGCLVSLLIAHSCMGGHGGRRQVASRKEERSAALTIQFSRNREVAIEPLHNTTDIFHQFLGVPPKNFFAFFCTSLFASKTVVTSMPRALL